MTPEQEGEDARWVAAAAQGDREALGRLYDRYAPGLTALGLRVLGERREAEDVVHDVFLEVWRHAGEYDLRRGSVRAWLFMRMRSRALDRRKSAGFSRRVSLDADGLGEEAGDEDPRLAPDRAGVRRALLALPPEQREVIELAYFAGLSSTEVAEKLEIPVGTVKSRAAAGLAKLRAALAGARGVA
jgi:RNA polymerase sigma-70 factor (ECF subfamily)